MRKTKRAFAILLTICLAIGILPTTALASGMQANTPTFKLSSGNNTSVVAFAGKEWWVIGDGTNGVNPAANTVTLLAKEDNFGDSAFRTGRPSSFDNSAQYSEDNWYYANNPSGMSSWSKPNEYAGSTLQQKMVEIANGFDSRESALIKARTLTEGMNGPNVENQKLWALSASEWTAINDNTVRSYGDWWWLRSPNPHLGFAAWLGYHDGGNVLHITVSDDGYAVRPALSLYLTSVLFTSDASATSGKSSAAAGGNLVGALAPTGTVKFTVEDTENQKLTVEATEAQKTQSGAALTFAYKNATTGTKQYISCVLTDSTGAVKYYGKLKSCADSSAAKGAISVPLADVADGTYTLKIFSEQANGDLYTDFASQPVTMTVTVAGGTGTVSNYAGSSHTHDYEYTSISDTQHKGVCYCGDSTLSDHTGGVATCTSAKECADCSVHYGSVDANNHAWGDWTNTGDAQQHTRTCTRESSHTETAEHTYDNAADTTCNNCGYVRDDKYTVNLTHGGDGHGTVTASPYYAKQGDTVTLTATAHDGSVFEKWTGLDGLTITEGSATSATVKFTMPANDVSITAVFALEQTEPTPTPTPEPTPSPTDDDLDDVPDTGDDSRIGLLIGMVMLAAAGLVVCTILWKKYRQAR